MRVLSQAMLIQLLLSGLLPSCGGGTGTSPGGSDEGRDALLDLQEDPAHEASWDLPLGDSDVADVTPDDADNGPVAVDWHIPAISACTPALTACEAWPTEAAAATVRPDFYYPYENYPEDHLPDPAEGRRVQVAAVSAAGGAITRVEVRGRDVTAMALPYPGDPADPPQEVVNLVAAGFHWVHVWPWTLKPGQPFFVNFHLNDATLDGETALPLRVITDSGVALEASVPIARPAVRITYVTTTPDYGTVLVHVRNEDAVPRTLVRLVVNGLDVTGSACIPSATLAPGEPALWTVPLCRPLHPGDAWTVVADFEDAPSTAAAGRVVLPHYPIHAWVDSDDCPFPGANWANYLAHREKGFDMLFLRGLYGAVGCNGATARKVVSRSAHIPDQYYLLDEWADVEGLDDTRLARLMGDEVDSDWGVVPWQVSQRVKANWARNPRMTTYIGGARHRRTGAFAGTADVQGFDIYSAACAPSILEAQIPPLRAPYDYCRAVAANQAPGPHWFYSQGIAGWGPEGMKRDPNALELKVQAMSVAACGSKGLMYFMTRLDRAEAVPETWAAMGEVNRTIRAVREFLREGEPTGGAWTAEPDVLVDAIRARDAIVVPVVNAKVEQAVDWVRCILEEDPHWSVQDVTVDVAVDVPPDFAVADLLEVRNGEVIPGPPGAYAVGRTITIPSVTLTNDAPYRLFVLARTGDVADRMRAAVAVSDAGPEPADPFLPAVATCTPAAAPCDAPVLDVGLQASYRKDFFYPYETYPEAHIPDPSTGGRIQAAFLAAAGGPVTRVVVNGRDVTPLTVDWPSEAPPEVTTFTDDGWMHWIHVYPWTMVANAPAWVAFHSGAAWLDGPGPFALRVETEEGVALDGTFWAVEPDVPVRYVTPTPAYDALLVHLKNVSDTPRTLARLVVNGRDVTASSCIPSRTVRPGEAVLWTVPLCTPVSRGEAWTVVAQWDDGPPSVAVGRVLAPHFGIHSWPSSSDCPFPGANEANWRRHWEAGFDTLFLWKPTYANYEGCNGADASAILTASEAIPGQWLMVEKSISVEGHDRSRLLWFIGDEPDKELGTAPWNKARLSERLWRTTADMATYVGGSRHRRTGAFAGVSDIQGFDIYVSACAPYILDFGNFPPLRAPFDYARATRFNAAPWPTWFYSHGLLSGTSPDRQPSPAEVWVEAISPVAAGTKGLMFFQTNMAAADRHPKTWQAIAEAIRMVRGVRSLLVQGEPTGQVTVDPPDVLADAIQAPNALVIPVINARAEVPMNDIRCLLEEDPHWILAQVGATVRVTVPDAMSVAQVFEVRDGAVVEPAGLPYALGRDLVIPSVILSEERPARLYVVASDASVAARVAEDLLIPAPPLSP